MDPALHDWLTRPEGLAIRMRTMRQRTHLSGRDFAELLVWQASKVSRLERGHRLPSARDLEEWTAACGNPGAVDELIDLLAEAEAVKLNLNRVGRAGHAARKASLYERVTSSSVIRCFETAVIPGILQVPAYARRVLDERADLHGTHRDDLDDVVHESLAAQRLLDDDSPKRFEFLVTEAVLRWRLCGPGVMHAQLDRLQTVLYLPRVRFGVIAFDTQLATIPRTGFAIFDHVAYVETPRGEEAFVGTDAEFWSGLMDRLWHGAAEGEAARQLIVRAAGDLERT